MKQLVVLIFMLCASALLLAREAAPLAEDVAAEQRLVVISEGMRCLVCQNESLAASQADLAKDLRAEIREMIKQGKTNQQITAFMVDRYGDFVLYRPPLMATTYLLWFGPFLFLAFGVIALVIYLRRRLGRLKDETLSVEDRARADALLKQGE